MPLDFRWDVDEGGERETIARVARGRVPRWMLRLARWLVIALVTVGATAYGALRLRYEIARQDARRAIEVVIDAEARTYASADHLGYLAYQDSTALAWLSVQDLRASAGCATLRVCPDSRFPGLCSTAHFAWDQPTDGRDALCTPPGAAQVETLDLRGDRAWAIVRKGDPPALEAWFYRSTPAGWRHTAPDPEFWGEPVELRRRGVVIRYHQRDEPHIAALLEQIQATLSELEEVLRYWPLSGQLQIDFAITSEAFQAPYVQHRAVRPDTRLVLPSPWLWGIPVDGRWSTERLQRLRYWVTYAALSSRWRRDVYGDGPSLLHRALLSEYGAWYLRADPSLSPILRRVIARHGEDALPSVFLSLRGGRLLGLFLVRWLSVHPGGPSMFELLLAIEQEALRAGQRETFLLGQDESWRAEREAFFAAAQTEVAGPLPTPRVRAVDLLGDYARVQLATAPPPPLDGPTQVEDGYAYFAQENWDWKRTSTAAATHWRPVPAPTATP
jgi:hypothetical protein